VSGPLAGIKIVEIAGLGAAPYGCMMLADMGAEIIRVDRLPAGSQAARPIDPLLRSRRSIALDLKKTEALEVLMRLIARADVMIEAFRPGVAERLGFGPEPCLAANPRLVYARMTGWGQTGPLAPTAGHDINYIALTGLLHQIGTPEGRPVPPLNVVGDFGGGGLLMAFGVLCAYIEVQRSGKGQVIDAAMIDGATSFLAMAFGQQANGCWRDATGANWVAGAAHFYGTYRTRDGAWIAVGSIEPQFHRLLIERLGLDLAEFEPGLLVRSADRYPGLVDEIWPRLKPKLAAAIAARTRAEVMELFEGTDACVTPVLSLEEAQRHPHNMARATFVSVDGHPQNAPAPRFSRTSADMPRPPAIEGEHTAEILAEAGYSQSEIAALAASGVAAVAARQERGDRR
jgi:alpha-methylacyl-CoA racemase